MGILYYKVLIAIAVIRFSYDIIMDIIVELHTVKVV